MDGNRDNRQQVRFCLGVILGIFDKLSNWSNHEAQPIPANLEFEFWKTFLYMLRALKFQEKHLR